MKTTERNGAPQAPIGRSYKEVPVKSALPIWAATAVWGISMFAFPMYRIPFLVLTAALSAGAGILTAKFVPKETRRIEIPFTSGNADIDSTVAELNRVEDAILADSKAAETHGSTAAAEEMKTIAALTGKIRAELIRTPDDMKKLRKFFNYYLPVTVKLTGKYTEIIADDKAGDNRLETRRAIEGTLGQIRSAFEKQYDALFADDAMDITTDIDVLEAKMKMDNLN